MEDLFDLHLILSSLACFLVILAAYPFIHRSKQKSLFVSLRDKYIAEQTQRSSEMDEDIERRCQELQAKYKSMLNDLSAFGIVESETSSHNHYNKDELERTKASLEKSRLLSGEYDREIKKIKKSLGIDDTISSEGEEEQLMLVDQLIERIMDENMKLASQIKGQTTKSQSTLSLENIDQEMLEFKDKHDYTTDTLNELYEFILDLQAKKQDQDLNRYLASPEQRGTSHKYSKELTELDVKRKAMELRLEQTRLPYAEEVSSFTDSRIEYLFKITGLRELLAQLQERDRIAERRKEFELKNNDLSQTS